VLSACVLLAFFIFGSYTTTTTQTRTRRSRGLTHSSIAYSGQIVLPEKIYNEGIGCERSKLIPALLNLCPHISYSSSSSSYPMHACLPSISSPSFPFPPHSLFYYLYCLMYQCIPIIYR